MAAFKYEKAYQFFSNFHRHSPFHRMPDHYKRMLVRMIEETPTAVHYLPETREWVKSPQHLLTGGWKRVANTPIPLIYPKEFHEGLWGGEAVIKGYKKPLKPKNASKVPHWWIPVLKRTIVRSEILDKYMSVVVTERALNLIDQNYGLDYYILKTDVIDLRSNLALKLRSKMLLALARKDMYPDDPVKREEIYEKYKQYIIPEEEAEWMGLTVKEALAKQRAIDKQLAQRGPLKIKYRKELVERLKEMKLEEISSQERKNWITRLNPFSKPSSANNPETAKD